MAEVRIGVKRFTKSQGGEAQSMDHHVQWIEVDGVRRKDVVDASVSFNSDGLCCIDLKCIGTFEVVPITEGIDI